MFHPTCLWLHWFAYRRQQEAESKIIQEETAKRVEEAVRKKVHEALHSEELKKEIEMKIQEGRKKIFDDIASQLETEKGAALAEARRKEVGSSPSCVYYMDIIRISLAFWSLLPLLFTSF